MPVKSNLRQVGSGEASGLIGHIIAYKATESIRKGNFIDLESQSSPTFTKATTPVTKTKPIYATKTTESGETEYVTTQTFSDTIDCGRVLPVKNVNNLVNGTKNDMKILKLTDENFVVFYNALSSTGPTSYSPVPKIYGMILTVNADGVKQKTCQYVSIDGIIGEGDLVMHNDTIYCVVPYLRRSSNAYSGGIRIVTFQYNSSANDLSVTGSGYNGVVVPLPTLTDYIDKLTVALYNKMMAVVFQGNAVFIDASNYKTTQTLYDLPLKTDIPESVTIEDQDVIDCRISNITGSIIALEEQTASATYLNAVHFAKKNDDGSIIFEYDSNIKDYTPKEIDHVDCMDLSIRLTQSSGNYTGTAYYFGGTEMIGADFDIRKPTSKIYPRTATELKFDTSMKYCTAVGISDTLALYVYINADGKLACKVCDFSTSTGITASEEYILSNQKIFRNMTSIRTIENQALILYQEQYAYDGKASITTLQAMLVSVQDKSTIKVAKVSSGYPFNCIAASDSDVNGIVNAYTPVRR